MKTPGKSKGAATDKRSTERSKPKRAPATRRREEQNKLMAVKLLVRTHRYGSDSDVSHQVVTAYMRDDETVELSVSLAMRFTDKVEIVPVRRGVGDAKAVVRDAIRLANTPTTG